MIIRFLFNSYNIIIIPIIFIIILIVRRVHLKRFCGELVGCDGDGEVLADVGLVEVGEGAGAEGVGDVGDRGQQGRLDASEKKTGAYKGFLKDWMN